MSSSRKRRVPARMRRTERPRGSIPENDNADAQYVALLLREEELIEAIRLVDPMQASEMEKSLDKVTRVPWSKLEQSDESSDEVRLDRLHSIQRTRDEVEEAIQRETQEGAFKRAHEVKIREHKARLAFLSPQTLLTDKELTNAILAFIDRRSRPKRCPDNGDFGWSRRVWNIKQQAKYDEQDKAHPRGTQDQVYGWRYKGSRNVKWQFRSANRPPERHWRRLPDDDDDDDDDLAYRPFDAVTLFNEGQADYAWKSAAKRIQIIVTDADDEDEYQKLF